MAMYMSFLFFTCAITSFSSLVFSEYRSRGFSRRYKRIYSKNSESTECPEGTELFNCFVNPCEVSSCAAIPEAICKPNFCGGCFAEFFDENGDKLEECNECPILCLDGLSLVSCAVNPCEVTSCPADEDAMCLPSQCGSCSAVYITEGERVDCQSPCDPNPCENNGVCALKTGYKRSYYKCICPPGFCGRNCEHEDTEGFEYDGEIEKNKNWKPKIGSWRNQFKKWGHEFRGRKKRGLTCPFDNIYLVRLC